MLTSWRQRVTNGTAEWSDFLFIWHCLGYSFSRVFIKAVRYPNLKSIFSPFITSLPELHTCFELMHMPLLAFKALYNARKYISRPISRVRSNSDIWFQWRRLQVQFVFWIIFLIIQFPPHLRLFLSLSSILNFVKKRDKQNSYMGKSVVFINLSSGLNTLMSNWSSRETNSTRLRSNSISKKARKHISRSIWEK